jgi:hypothetical protein
MHSMHHEVEMITDQEHGMGSEYMGLAMKMHTKYSHV